MFTDPTLTEKDLKAPPVAGCKCACCEHMRYYKHTYYVDVPGYDRYLPDTLRGLVANEAHNPENLGRRQLAPLVPKEDFDYYVRTKNLWFQGASGLWYFSGMKSSYAHYIYVYAERKGDYFRSLCLPSTQVGPLASMLAVQVLGMRYMEKESWAILGLNPDTYVRMMNGRKAVALTWGEACAS